jgi:hypothetical protein
MNIFKKEKNNQDVQEKNVKRNHLKMIIFLFILAMVVTAAGLIYFYAQKPARGIIKTASRSQEAETKNNDTPSVFTGEYLSFLYGNSYVLKSHDVFDENGAVILERAYLTEIASVSNVSKKIMLTVRDLPTHAFEDCPDFKIRSMDSKKYKKETFDFGEIKGISFEVADQSTHEKTFFLLHENYLAIISITSPALGDEKTNNEALDVIKSVSWHK